MTLGGADEELPGTALEELITEADKLDEPAEELPEPGGGYVVGGVAGI
jgi:hypothetical protein